MAEQVKMRREAGDSWVELGLLFRIRQGSALDAANVRRSFRLVASAAGLNHTEWTPRELRHSLVSLLSSSAMTIEEIAHFVGHGSTGGAQRGPEGTAPSHHTLGARHQRALRWRRQAIGRHSLADRSTDPSGERACMVANGWLTRPFFVGDTGFEPVTSSVSVISGTPDYAPAGAIEVRGRTQMTAGCWTD
jgi:hypothetical protein